MGGQPIGLPGLIWPGWVCLFVFADDLRRSRQGESGHFPLVGRVRLPRYAGAFS